MRYTASGEKTRVQTGVGDGRIGTTYKASLLPVGGQLDRSSDARPVI